MKAVPTIMDTMRIMILLVLTYFLASLMLNTLFINIVIRVIPKTTIVTIAVSSIFISITKTREMQMRANEMSLVVLVTNTYHLFVTWLGSSFPDFSFAEIGSFL